MALEEISQRELAARLEVSPSTVSEWLSGKAMPSKPNLAKMAEVLDAEVEDLLAPQASISIGSNSVVYVYNVYNVATGATVTTHIHNTGGVGTTSDAAAPGDKDRDREP